MINLSSSILIHRPAAAIFDFITVPANDFEWQYGTLGSSPTSAVPQGLGATFQTIGHVMGRRTQGTYEVTQYEASRRYGFRSLSGPLHLDTMFTLETGTGRTRVTVTTQAASGTAPQHSDRQMQRYMSRQLREDLALLKQVLEARAGASQPPI
jgi:hypothetical protein